MKKINYLIIIILVFIPIYFVHTYIISPEINKLKTNDCLDTIIPINWSIKKIPVEKIDSDTTKKTHFDTIKKIHF